MTLFRPVLVALALLGSTLACAAPPSAAAPQRLITLGGSVTEIVYALSAGDRVVANDLSSLYPEAATRVPRVGYYRDVPVEGVVALKPDLVIASEQAGPPESLERLKGLGVHVASVSDRPTLASLRLRVQSIAALLGEEPAGKRAIDAFDQALTQAQAQPGQPRRALVLMNRTGTPQAAGAGTAADAVLQLAGLHNVMAGVQGYKPVSAESILALAPELIVVTSASAQAMGGIESVRQSAGIAQTPAAANAGVIAIDDLLILGIGLRLPQAITQLRAASLGADSAAGSR